MTPFFSSASLAVRHRLLGRLASRLARLGGGAGRADSRQAVCSGTRAGTRAGTRVSGRALLCGRAGEKQPAQQTQAEEPEEPAQQTQHSRIENGEVRGPMQGAGVRHPGLSQETRVRRVQVHSTHRPFVRMLQTVLRERGQGRPVAVLPDAQVVKVQDGAAGGGAAGRQACALRPRSPAFFFYSYVCL